MGACLRLGKGITGGKPSSLPLLLQELVLRQLFSKCGPWTSNTCRNAHSQALSPALLTRNPEGERWGAWGVIAWGLGEVGCTLCFGSGCGELWCVLERETHWWRNPGPCHWALWTEPVTFCQLKSWAGWEVRLVSLKFLLELWFQAQPRVGTLSPLPPDFVSLILSCPIYRRETPPFGYLEGLNEGLAHSRWSKWKLLLVTIRSNEDSETSRRNYTNNNAN